VFNLSTGEVIQQRNVTCIPITDSVIKAVEALAKRDSMEAFKIEDKHGIILSDLAAAIACAFKLHKFLLDQDQYPKTINHAMNGLSNRKFDDKYYKNRKKN
jgi:hypothetical protein